MQNLLTQSLNALVSALSVADTDYWHDVVSCEAAQILDDEGDPLLVAITDNIQSWSCLQQEHLAYILGSGFSARELHLINLLVESDDADVKFRAQEALQNYKSKSLLRENDSNLKLVTRRCN